MRSDFSFPSCTRIWQRLKGRKVILERAESLVGGTRLPSQFFQAVYLQAVKQKPPGHLILTKHPHTVSLFYPRDQIEVNVGDRNINLRNRRLLDCSDNGL